MYVEYHTINYTEAQEARLKATAMAEEWKQGIIMVWFKLYAQSLSSHWLLICYELLMARLYCDLFWGCALLFLHVPSSRMWENEAKSIQSKEAGYWDGKKPSRCVHYAYWVT